MIRRLILLGVGLMAAGPLRAELRWEKPIQEFHRTPQDKSVEAKFAFKNVGAAPVTIENIRTSCGCTSADPDKKTYAPGESGEIKAKFTFGGRIGGQRKLIRVFTSDRGNEPAVLDLRVFIEEPLKVNPALVFWRTGEAPSPKTVQITAAPDRPVRVKEVTTSGPAFKATLQTIKAGEEYAISIVPTGTAGKQVGVINIETDFPPDAPRIYKVHARVK
jgi:hypothetical protein